MAAMRPFLIGIPQPNIPQKTATGEKPNDHQISTIPALSMRRAQIQTTAMPAMAIKAEPMTSGITDTGGIVEEEPPKG